MESCAHLLTWPGRDFDTWLIKLTVHRCSILVHLPRFRPVDRQGIFFLTGKSVHWWRITNTTQRSHKTCSVRGKVSAARASITPEPCGTCPLAWEYSLSSPKERFSTVFQGWIRRPRMRVRNDRHCKHCSSYWMTGRHKRS
jgi:hypothetical protein